MIARSDARAQQETARQNLGGSDKAVTASDRVERFLDAWNRKRDQADVIFSLTRVVGGKYEAYDLLASDLDLLLNALEADNYAEGYTAGRRDLAEYLSRLADRLRERSGGY